MPSTYSSLKFELIATGEQAGTWGNTTNVNIGTAIEEAITGSATVTFTSGANTAIALTNTNAAQTARNLRLDLSGTMTTSQYLYVPAIEKFYIINNTLSNTVIVSNGSNAAATGTAVSVPRSTSVMLFNDGVNVTSAISHIPSLANVTISSGNATVTNLTATSANLTNANVTSVLTVAAGTNAAPAITTSGDTNTGIFFPAADTIAFTEGGVERMRLDSSGNVGIGTSSPTNALSVSGNANITGNTTLGDASTDTVTVNGYMGVGVAPNANRAINVAISAGPTAATGVYGVFAAPTRTSAGNDTNTGSFVSRPVVNATALTVTSVDGFYADNVTLTAGTVTNQYGIRIADLTSGTNNFGITSLVSSGSNKWNIYASGTAANYFAGQVNIGTTDSNVTSSSLPGINLFSSGLSAWCRDGAMQYLNRKTTDGDFLILQRDGSTKASIGISSSSLTTTVDGSERLRLSTTEAVFNDPGNDYDFRVESDTNTHALFVDAGNSRVGINQSSPSFALDLKAASNEQMRIDGTSATDTTFLMDYNGGGATNRIRLLNKAGDFAVNTNNTEECFRAVQTGRYLRLASGTGGIQFNGDTAAANALDDYEEGDWTPVFQGGTTAGTYTYNTQSGRYIKVGKQVTVWCTLVDITASSAGTGDMYVSGLPFTVLNNTVNDRAPCGATRVRQVATALGSMPTVGGSKGNAYAFFLIPSGTTDTALTIATYFANSMDIGFTLTYETA